MNLNNLLRIAGLLKIANQAENSITSLVLTPIQSDWIKTIDANQYSICLKSRQVYVSTASLYYVLMWAITHPGLTAAVYIDSYTKATNFLHIIEDWLGQLGIKCTESNSKYIRLPNDTTIRAFSAVSRAPGDFSRAGRSTTAHLLYFSEMAFYSDPEALFASATASATPDAKIIIESTSSGEGTFFAKLYNTAGWVSRFYGIEAHPAYTSDLPITNKEWANLQTLGFTSRPHASFFQQRLTGFYIGDLKRLLLEMPILEEHAWLSISGRFIDRDLQVIPYITNKIRDLHIYQPPTAKTRYIIGYDPSGGTERDHAAIAVGDLYTGRLCASWAANNLDTDQQIEVLKQIYGFYNIPEDRHKFSDEKYVHTIAVERNGVGLGLLPFLRKQALPLYEVTTESGNKDFSKYANFLQVKRAVESSLLQGDQHLADEVKGLARDSRGRFVGKDDLIAATSFYLGYIARHNPQRPATALDPHIYFDGSKAFKQKRAIIP
ncbi:MAG TPA: hypothetical protein VJ327_11265 [Patescibacteria group bacterium]|nr:hypothetical protein [Patescibacteria group bacterium]